LVSQMDVFLGVNNCWAVKRFVEPREWVEITATRLEVDLVQFSYDLLDPRSRREVVKEVVEETLDAARDYGVKIHSTFTGLAAYSFNLLMHPNPGMRADALDWYEQAVRVAGMFKAEATGGHVAAMSWRDHRDPERRKYLLDCLIEALKYLSGLGKKHGLKMLLWEPMPVAREPPATLEEAKKLIKRVNEGASIPVKYCIDLGHACNPWTDKKEDLDPYAWLRSLGAESPCIHVQQTDGLMDRHWPFTEEYNSKGIIKPDKVLEALKESGSSGNYLFLEIIHPFEYREDKVLEELEKSVKYWKDFI